MGDLCFTGSSKVSVRGWSGSREKWIEVQVWVSFFKFVFDGGDDLVLRMG